MSRGSACRTRLPERCTPARPAHLRACPCCPATRLLFPRPTLRGVWLGMLLLYSAACIILPIIWKGERSPGSLCAEPQPVPGCPGSCWPTAGWRRCARAEVGRLQSPRACSPTLLLAHAPAVRSQPVDNLPGLQTAPCAPFAFPPLQRASAPCSSRLSRQSHVCPASSAQLRRSFCVQQSARQSDAVSVAACLGPGSNAAEHCPLGLAAQGSQLSPRQQPLQTSPSSSRCHARCRVFDCD